MSEAQSFPATSTVYTYARYSSFPLFYLLLAGLLILWVGGCSTASEKSPTPEVPSAVEAPSSTHRPEQEILTEIKSTTEKLGCCLLTALDVRNGVVTLEGYTQNEQQGQKLIQAIKSIDGVTKVVSTLDVFPKPFSEAIALLHPFQLSKEDTAALQMRPSKGCAQTYYGNEYLVIDVSLPQTSQYVYVDYYTADTENVTHLFPNPFQPHNFLQKTTALTLGEPTSQVQWQLQPPFGLELLTVITSPQPLFARNRLDSEPVQVYLTELRKALPRETPTSSDVNVTYCFITSKASTDQGQDEAKKAGEGQAQPQALEATQQKEQDENEESAAPKEEQIAEESAAPSVEFFDMGNFDSKLSSALKSDPPQIMVQFPAPITVNNIPQRLNNWFATVEKHGGTVALLEDPDQAGPKTRFISSLGLTLAIGAYELIKNKLLYGPVKEYNAKVYYVKKDGKITKVVFTRK